MNAFCWPVVFSEWPTTTPYRFTSVATLDAPPSVPRSLIVFALDEYRNACDAPSARSELPTASPVSPRPKARLSAPPSVPRSVMKYGAGGMVCVEASRSYPATPHTTTRAVNKAARSFMESTLGKEPGRTALRVRLRPTAEHASTSYG